MSDQSPGHHPEQTKPELDVIKLEIDQDGSPVTLEPASWFVCFVPGLQKQWWHLFVRGAGLLSAGTQVLGMDAAWALQAAAAGTRYLPGGCFRAVGK